MAGIERSSCAQRVPCPEQAGSPKSLGRPRQRRAPRRARLSVLLALGLSAACAKSPEQWRVELFHPDPFVRGMAAIALCEAGPEHAGPAVPVLLETLEGSKRVLHPAAQRALGRLGNQQAEQLVARLRNEHELPQESRALLLDSLTTVGPAAVPLIVRTLRDPGASNPLELGKVLARIGRPAVEPVAVLLRHGEERERVWAAWILGRIGEPARPVLGDLIDAADHGTARVMQAAIEALPRIEPEGHLVMPSLYRASSSDDALVRDVARRATARVLLRRTHELHPENRRPAIGAMLALGPQAWTVLIEAVDSGQHDAERTVATACVNAIGATIELAPKVREPARTTDAGASPPAESPLAGLGHDQPDARALAALSLARAGCASRLALPLLAVIAAQDPHQGVRLCAHWAIWSIVLDACGSDGNRSRGSGCAERDTMPLQPTMAAVGETVAPASLRDAPPPAAARLLRALWLVLACGVSSAGLALLLADRVPLAAVLGQGFVLLAAGYVLALSFEVIALARLARGRGPSPAIFGDLRTCLVVAALFWASFLALVPSFERLWFDLALGIGAGGLALAFLLERPLEVLPRRLRRGIDVALFSVCAAVLLSEVGLRVFAQLRPAQIFVRNAMEPSEVLRSNRLPAGAIPPRLPRQRAGTLRRSVRAQAPGRARIATIGDSFSLGVVAHSKHYTSVCERALGLPVDNFGVASVGVREYEQMLLEEVIPLTRDFVVISIFIGNDLPIAARGASYDGVRAWFDRDQVLLVLVPTRLAKIQAEKDRRGDQGVTDVQGTAASGGDLVAEADLQEIYPWLHKPELEVASMSEEAFLPIEVDRAVMACGDPIWWPDFQSALESIFAGARSTPVAVMLIPDEFQVEDALWEKVQTGSKATGLVRDRPQRLIVPWLASRGIPCLDLFPIFRAAPLHADGRHHLYHLHDTHWNADGNQLAGEALARFLAPLLQRRP